MKSSNIITLLTDFGDRDVYVGVMKGVIAQIAPQTKIIDLTHQIPPQNLLAARFALLNAYPYFPADTVYVAVVDPGVGSNRRGIALKLDRGYLVCPDNGLGSGILDSAIAAVELNNREYWRVLDPSQTFHGRDIFAPAAAHLARGVPLEQLGSGIKLESLVKLDLPTVEILNQREINGCIQDIDHFGNLITNIPGSLVGGNAPLNGACSTPSDSLKNQSWQINVKEIAIKSGKTYSEVNQGELITLIGSHSWVEIAINSGNAAQQLQLTWGDRIQLIINK